MKRILSKLFPVLLCLFHFVTVFLSFMFFFAPFLGFSGVPLIVCAVASALLFAAVLVFAAVKRGGIFMLVYTAILLCASVIALAGGSAIDITIPHVIASMPFFILLVVLEEHAVIAHSLISLFYASLFAVCVIRRVPASRRAGNTPKMKKEN